MTEDWPYTRCRGDDCFREFHQNEYEIVLINGSFEPICQQCYQDDNY